MTLTEMERNQLHNDLAAAIGPGSAGAVMSLLPPVGWDWTEVAKKSDVTSAIDGLRLEMKAGFAELRAELRSDISGLRSEFSGLRAEFKSDIAALTRNLFFGLSATLAAYSSLIVAFVLAVSD